MRISDWSPDVCSSDLIAHLLPRRMIAFAPRDEGHAFPMALQLYPRQRPAGIVALRIDADHQPGIGVGLRTRILAHAVGDDAPLLRSRRHHPPAGTRSEEHTSQLQSLMRISYSVFCLKKQTINT